MPLCGTQRDVALRNKTAELTREQKEMLMKLKVMKQHLENDDVFRASIGIDGRGGDPNHEFAQWVMRRLGASMDPRVTPLTSGDINFLYSEMVRAKEARERTKKWSSDDKFHAWVNKWIFLPQDVFRRDIIGGSDYFLDTQLLRSDRDRMRSVAGSNLQRLDKRLKILTGVEKNLVDKVLIPAEERLGRAKQDLMELEKAPNKDPELVRKAKSEVRNAEAALNNIMRGHVNDPSVSRAIRIIRTIQTALDGKYIVMDAVTGEESTRGFKTIDVVVREAEVDTGQGLPPMPILITEKKVDRNHLRAVLSDVIKDPRGVNQAEQIVKEIADFLDDFSQITRLGFKAERENMIYRAMRNGRGITRETAAKLVDKAMNLKIEDIYFPRESVTALNRIERMSVEMDTASDLVPFLTQAAANPEKFSFPGESTSHVLERKYNLATTDASHDMMGVLGRYSSRMIDYYHNNQLHLVSNRLLDRLWSVHKNMKSPEDAALFEKYVEGVTNYIADFVDRSKNSTQGGKMHEVMKTLVAWKAGMTMGFFNPSSPVLNLAEGQAVILIRAGKHYFMNRERENEWGQIIKELDMGMEFTGLTEDTMIGVGDAPILDARSYSNMDNATRRAVGLVEIDRERIWLRRAAKVSSEFAKRGLILQKKAENINRARAFKVGALMEWEWLSQYREIFIGDAPRAKDMILDSELEALGVTREDLNNEGNRREIWKRMAKRRLTRAGFEMVYQTQFNYNQVARHFAERTDIGKLAMMYQHYPLSWLSSWRRTYEVLTSLYKSGAAAGGVRSGIKAMVEPTSKDKSLSPLRQLSTNNEMQFALITGAIVATLTAIRYSTGIVAGQLFNHPVTESTEDMIKYVKYGFDGTQEERKKLFWGKGIVNQFTGPVYSDVMDAISLGFLRAGIEDGDLPMWLADGLRGTVGFRPNEMLLTESGRRNFHNAWDVTYETFLFGGFSVAPKAARYAKNIPGISTTLSGKPATLKDFSYATMRSIGFRDEKLAEGIQKSAREKEGRI